VEPLEYMSPFLEVIRSPETSGDNASWRWMPLHARASTRRVCYNVVSKHDQTITMAAGPITGCALGAVRRILDQNVLGESDVQQPA
jgi:hypothetical protein